ncbi:MAG: S53 family peptidase [Acidobacteriia bacterium]|nr:S53 family peptidase [Terriglobia bacterium]
MNRKREATLAGAGIHGLLVAFVVVMGCAVVSAAPVGKFVAHNTPRYVATAPNLGAEDPAKVIDVSIWLQMHNRSEFDALTQSLYDRNSPNYHHWLKRKDIAARFAPTALEAKTVRQFFRAHNLKVVKTGPNNFYVRARGTVGDVEKAFRIQLNNYQVNGKTIRANASDPYVEGAAGVLVSAVSGLDSAEFDHPAVARPASFSGNNPVAASARATAKSAVSLTSPSFFSSQCFTTTETETFSNNNDGSFPIGTYSGNKLNLQTQTDAGCAYTPPSIAAAYNLNGLYGEGYDGTGQTIAIIDWCGSATIQDDANAFSAQFGLPPLTSSNFAITYTAPSLCISWEQTEINIDVEWAHAIAPGANINLVVPPSATFLDVDQAELDVVDLGLGNVLSGSYGVPEAFLSTAELDIQNAISEMGAAMGISMNFSSGDLGDFSIYGIPPTVSAPADSPWATAVGGVSLALKPDNSIAWQAGWGTNETLLTETGFIFDPPLWFGFQYGSGGGPANCVVNDQTVFPTVCLAGFPKPWYQKGKVPGKWRQLPDISWLADPFTGAAILISIPGQIPAQVWQVYGGTSVATPMFSGLWAIANQEAIAGGGSELGQAAPYLYSMPAGTIFDVVPVKSKHNVTASIQEPTGTNFYDTNNINGGASAKKFLSALWDYPYLQFTSLVITFGSDCADLPADFFDGTPCNDPKALHTKLGWDNVTGVGTPNGQAFADYFYGK